MSENATQVKEKLQTTIGDDHRSAHGASAIICRRREGFLQKASTTLSA